MRDRMGVCGSCCNPCLRASHEDPYSVRAGTWTPIANGLETSDPLASVLYLPESQPAIQWRAQVSIAVLYLAGAEFDVFLAANASAPPIGGEQQLHFGWSATGPYVSLGGNRHPDGAPGCNIGSPPVFPGTTSITLIMCWDGSVLSAEYVGGSISGFLANGLAISSGGRAGFGTGIMSGVTAVRFSSFFLFDSEQQDCVDCPEHCCKGSVPNLVMAVAGFPPFVVDPNHFCTFDLSALNGTIPLARSCAGGAGCAWSATVDTFKVCNMGGSIGLVTSDAEIIITVILARNIVTGFRVLRVQLFATDAFGVQLQLGNWTLVTETPCEQMIIPLPLSGTPVGVTAEISV